MRVALILLLLVAAPLAMVQCGGSSMPGPSSPSSPSPSGTPDATKIRHVIIVIQENRTPDNLFGAAGIPGADIQTYGYTSTGAKVQLQPISLTAPYDIDHSHDRAWVRAYDNGAMNGFDLETTSPKPSATPSIPPNPQYGYVPQSEDEPYYQMARDYTFADRMFQTNEGPSLPAHQYLLSGTDAVSAGSDMYDAENPDYATNMLDCDGSPNSTVELINLASGVEGGTQSLVCFDHPTLFDSLDAKSVSYTYYAYTQGGLWNAPDAIRHIRFGTDWSHVVIPNTTIFNDISAGRLSSVSWVIPTTPASDHAGSTDGSGPSWVASVVNAVGNSQYWNSTVIFVLWDDWGGWYDHVAPQRYNGYELGFRVPLIVISPYAKRGYVSHVQHEFGSILRYTEELFDLQSLGNTDARADDLSDCFDYSQAPTKFQPFVAKHNANYFLHLPSSNIPLDY
ncbi:MAG TPA: alkaline phosphatase family protein [Candidatus Baltobacteraceae bacterium]|nr:alkaline phosphatase family protein [Candidatus Baltobacteraceae bacterium]